MTTLNSIGQQFQKDLAQAHLQSQAEDTKRLALPKVHIAGAGGAITAAYEQLRNAAEYTEEHVLLQHAIRRFYRQLFLMRDVSRIEVSGEELVVELTLAGYLPNDSVPEAEIQRISKRSKEYYDAYQLLLKNRSVSHTQADQWTYELLAVEIEWIFSDTNQLQAFTQFAHNHYSATIDSKLLFRSQPADFETALFVAIHRALLKSDEAVIRLGLLRRYRRDLGDIEQYVTINKQIDSLLTSPTTEKLYRLVDRRGAPLRVLRQMGDDESLVGPELTNKDNFLLSFEKQVGLEYESINRRVNSGIVRSVIFLIITKFLIGLAIEIPYDKIVIGTIMWVPLLINLLFPPIYMILLRGTLMLPGPANTKRLVEQIDATLYGELPKKQLSRRAKEFGNGFNIAYGLLFVLVFGGAAYLLWSMFEFELVHLVVFFIFLSTASFLGFRLSRMIREIESLDTNQNSVTLIRDFLYMPFVVVGRFLSDKYSKVNIVALALDMLIELPLKTTLRLVRQWAAFISAKKDEI